MATCANCGVENPEGARFCNACGAPLPAEPREVRKTVTVVFADLTGSTALGEGLDPEALRGVMRRYHAELRTILERHGGTVEKFIGDAVMAVFGLPRVHEDDALRAVRAAAELKQAVEELDLRARIGVNTGDVVAGEGETLVTGDAVNVAARLEQAAAPGEILLGEQTHVLVGDAVRAEPIEPLSLKGKTHPVPAFRLHEVLADVPAFTRRIDAPFVGRDDELRELEASYQQAVEDRACRLQTIVGAPGIGKSRLARELLGRVNAQVLVGRCLPYGEGITYWPLAEIVGQLPRSVSEIVEKDENAEAVAERVTGALGAAHRVGAAEEIAWAFRKLFESLARERPLIAVVDDIHWAEPTLLDLLEYIVTFAGDAPMLVLCLARPDLFERRPSWSNPRPNASVISLEPLAEQEAHALADQLGTSLSHESRTRLVDAAEGNPLFVEQLVAMHVEGGDGEVTIPPTIQALLAARIDRLEPGERNVIERASVEGRLFHRGAVAELLSDSERSALGSHLMALVRKEFIRPDRSLFSGDDGFRFGHILIRDAAYDSIPKRLRAELHERFADWLADRARERAGEFDEILGYHLEQAMRYRVELEGSDDITESLGRRTAAHLTPAGQRALARGDIGGATNLLERAAASAPIDDPLWPTISNLLGRTRMDAGELEAAHRAFDAAVEAADRLGDRPAAARAAVMRSRLGIIEGRGAPDEMLPDAERLIAILEEVGDDEGLATAWLLVVDIGVLRLRSADMMQAAERARVHAGRAGAGRDEAEAIFWIVVGAVVSLEPTTEAAARCEDILREPHGPVVEAHVNVGLGAIRAFQGKVEESRRLRVHARQIYRDLGMRLWAAGTTFYDGMAELVSGDLVAAENALRASASELEEMGESGYRSTQVAMLARALSLQGRDDEAERLAAEALALSTDDVVNDIICGGVRARIAARRGDLDAAVALAEEAVRRSDSVEWFVPDVYTDLAEVMRLAGRRDDETSALRHALRLYERKGVVPAVERTRAQLEAAAS